jgi:hypothetical protein
VSSAIADFIERFVYGIAHGLSCLAHDDDGWDDEETVGVPTIVWPSPPHRERAEAVPKTLSA